MQNQNTNTMLQQIGPLIVPYTVTYHDQENNCAQPNPPCFSINLTESWPGKVWQQPSRPQAGTKFGDWSNLANHLKKFSLLWTKSQTESKSHTKRQSISQTKSRKKKRQCSSFQDSTLHWLYFFLKNNSQRATKRLTRGLQQLKSQIFWNKFEKKRAFYALYPATTVICALCYHCW